MSAGMESDEDEDDFDSTTETLCEKFVGKATFNDSGSSRRAYARGVPFSFGGITRWRRSAGKLLRCKINALKLHLIRRRRSLFDCDYSNGAQCQHFNINCNFIFVKILLFIYQLTS